MRLLLAWALVCGAANCGAQAPSPADAGVARAEEWVGRALLLRGFPNGSELKYDANGRLQGEKKLTDWTLAGFDLQKVSRRPDHQLELDGVRVAIRYNPDQHIFERHPLKDDKIRVILAEDKPESVPPALAAIFSVGIDPELQRSMPSYWSHYFIPSLPWPADELTGQTVFAANGKAPAALVFPVPEKKPEPGFTAEAERDHVRGAVLVRVEVDADGLPRRMVIRQPLGYGLDARTIETLEKYRFKPGTLDGRPVPVEMTVEQQFQ